MSKKNKELSAREKFAKELAKATINGWKVGFQNLKTAYANFEKELEEKRAKRSSELSALQWKIDEAKEEIVNLENARYFKVASMLKNSETKAFNLRKSTTGNLLCFMFPKEINQPRLWYLNQALKEVEKNGLKAACLLVHPRMEQFMFSDNIKSVKYGDFRVFVTDKVADDVVLIATL